MYMVGTTYRHLGASEWALMKNIEESGVPADQPCGIVFDVWRAFFSHATRPCPRLSRLFRRRACRGFAEMCFSGEFGADVDLARVKQSKCATDAEILFSESPCRMLLEVAPQSAAKLEALFSNSSCVRIGGVTKGDAISVTGLSGKVVLACSRIDAKAAWKSTLQF